MVGHAKYSYHAAYVSTVVIGTCILAFTIGLLIWRMCQRRRTESQSSRGARSLAHHALDSHVLSRLLPAHVTVQQQTVEYFVTPSNLRLMVRWFSDSVKEIPVHGLSRQLHGSTNSHLQELGLMPSTGHWKASHTHWESSYMSSVPGC